MSEVEKATELTKRCIEKTIIDAKERGLRRCSAGIYGKYRYEKSAVLKPYFESKGYHFMTDYCESYPNHGAMEDYICW